MALTLLHCTPPSVFLELLESKDWEGLEALISSGFPVNACWGEGGSVFERFTQASCFPSPPIPHSLEHQAQMRVLEALIEAGLSPGSHKALNKNQLVPLAVAALAGRADFVRRLLDDAHAPNGLGSVSQTPLAALALRKSQAFSSWSVPLSGIRSCVLELVEAGASVNEPIRGGWLPLTLAAKMNDCEMVALLLEHGALVNARAPGIPKEPGPRYAPVCWAVHHNDERLLQLLLAHGASLSASMEPGVGVVEYAGRRAGPDVWRQLVAREGMDSAAVSRGWFRAVAANRQDVVMWFLCSGMSATHCSEEGWTPLDVACEHQAMDVIALLVSAGADPHRLGQDGLSPLSRLRQKGGRKALEKVGWGMRPIA